MLDVKSETYIHVRKKYWDYYESRPELFTGNYKVTVHRMDIDGYKCDDTILYQDDIVNEIDIEDVIIKLSNKYYLGLSDKDILELI